MTILRKTPVALTSNAASFAIRSGARRPHVVAREALLDACFGANRRQRTCQRLRDGRAPAEGLALSAVARGPAWSGPCGCGTSAPGVRECSCSARWR